MSPPINDTERWSAGELVPGADVDDIDAVDEHIGVVLNDRYRVESKLGKGGHGNVYAGTQIGTGRKVGIKMLRPEAIDDPELEGRFRHEGLVLCSLKSAHTVVTYDVDQTDDGTMYIIMELLEGRTLAQMIDDEAPLDWRRVLDIVMQICIALTEAHARSIVHRDLKPANIHVEQRPGRAEFVKVLDFGIAKILHGEPLGMSTVPKLTARGQTVGTLRYMSPEQLLGTKLDGRSDIYSLGVVTYELMTGQVPFPDAVKAAQLIAAQLRIQPKAPSHVYPEGGIPPDVDELLLSMLAKESELRFDSAEFLAKACERALLVQDNAATERMPMHVNNNEAITEGSPADMAFVTGHDAFAFLPSGTDNDDEALTTRMVAQGNDKSTLLVRQSKSRDTNRLLIALIVLSVGLAIAIALVVM